MLRDGRRWQSTAEMLTLAGAMKSKYIFLPFICREGVGDKLLLNLLSNARWSRVETILFTSSSCK